MAGPASSDPPGLSIAFVNELELLRTVVAEDQLDYVVLVEADGHAERLEVNGFGVGIGIGRIEVRYGEAGLDAETAIPLYARQIGVFLRVARLEIIAVGGGDDELARLDLAVPVSSSSVPSALSMRPVRLFW